MPRTNMASPLKLDKSMILVVFLVLSALGNVYSFDGKLIYAVNAGGDDYVDSLGIRYIKDPLEAQKIGIRSDYGKHIPQIGRVPPQDFVLYQTERYHSDTFGYDIDVKEDGDYVLVMKFCEVYFNLPDQKVFDIVLNGEHTIVTDLDIFNKVGKGVAHDEYVPFRVEKDKLVVNNEESEINNSKIRVEFIKGYKDNPKINAFYVLKGQLSDVPKLPPLPAPLKQEEILEELEEPEVTPKSRPRVATTAPKVPIVEESEEASIMFPVFIAIGAFIPVLFILCKL